MIDRATVDKILDAADIVDVVSDFVTLKRRGTNWIGLCPFHNDHHPSFSVSRSKGICKCFVCGKGGSAVNFIMEIESMTYVEALRYLARKYGIEIHERELTDQERQAQDQRESMLVVNEFAAQFFEQQLHNTQEGQEIGMAYFRERGFNDESLKKFRLGYSPERRDAFYQAATHAGYNREVLFAVGLCFDDNHGGGFDRFRGRVMFPIFNVAGKVVGFGGRTLKNDPAKYVNSPESLIYSKRNEIYGLYQAKRAISKQDKCFLVEGYADVIQMHQSGFENVIASSGTALTDGQVNMIHRFTANVTEMFDGDAAGIHAALRGVDLLLRQGLNIKVLVLPEPEDPDSYARTHSATQIQAYIDQHETDFIEFKTRQLLSDTKDDPIKRAQAVNDILKSVSVIPDDITRAIYAKECSRQFGIDEAVINGEIAKLIAKNRDEEWKRREREKRQQQRETGQQAATPATSGEQPPVQPQPEQPKPVSRPNKQLQNCEFELIRYVAKYGMCYLCDLVDEQGNTTPATVCEDVGKELSLDSIAFANPVYNKILQAALGYLPGFFVALDEYTRQVDGERQQRIADGVARIRAEGGDNFEILEKKEADLTKRENARMGQMIEEFRKNYLEKRLCSDADDDVRHTSLELVSERYQLSKIHTQFATVVTEYDRLSVVVPEAIFNLKNAIIMQETRKIQLQLKQNPDAETTRRLLEQQSQFNAMRQQLAKFTGERVVNPLF